MASSTSVIITPTTSFASSTSTSSQLMSISSTTALSDLQTTSIPVSSSTAPIPNSTPVPTSVPTSTATTTIPTTVNVTTTPDLVSCDNVTGKLPVGKLKFILTVDYFTEGYPVCSPDYCSSSRPKYARCSAYVSIYHYVHM